MSNKELNFEINILPILDILSVLICFLLLTAVWIQISTIDTKQAIGDNSLSNGKNPPSLWVTLESDGAIQLSLRDLPKTTQAKVRLESRLAKTGKGIDWTALESKLSDLKKNIPELKTGIVHPGAQSAYGDVIKIMDQLKQNQIEGVGLSPLG